MANILERAQACMLAGAYGDSLGAAVEFMSFDQIMQHYGVAGIQNPDMFTCEGHEHVAGSITDDTQQTLAVARGLAEARGVDIIDDIMPHIWKHLRKWRDTQEFDEERRSPGNNSLRALLMSSPGSVANPLNTSDSCGSLMRVHPVGVAYRHLSHRKVCDIGMATSALTHGGKEACVASGAMAAVIRDLMNDVYLGAALDKAVARMPRNSQVRRLTADAVNMAMSRFDPDSTIPDLGLGWNADEAFAISAFCALRFSDNPVKAIRTAVNHDGDSDSTGSITGAMMGAIHGFHAVPRAWRDRIEHNDELKAVAEALAI